MSDAEGGLRVFPISAETGYTKTGYMAGAKTRHGDDTAGEGGLQPRQQRRCKSIHISIYLYIYLSIHISIYIYVLIFVCIYISLSLSLYIKQMLHPHLFFFLLKSELATVSQTLDFRIS